HVGSVPYTRPCSVADRALALGIDGRVWWIGYLPDDLLPAHPSRRIARSRSSAPPHVGVGIFIVKNSRKTMAARFCNRQFASPCSQAWDWVWRPAMSSLRRRLELGEAFIEGFRRDRPHVDIDHFGELRGLRRREFARRDRGGDGGRRRHAVGGLIERRHLERDGLALPRWRQPVHAQANGRHIALFCHLDRLAPDRLGVIRQQTFHQQRCPIAGAARPAGEISALTLLIRMAYPFLWSPENTPGAAAAGVRATKNPAQSPARVAGVLSVNTLFWKILVTRVKRIMRAFWCGGVSCVSKGG